MPELRKTWPDIAHIHRRLDCNVVTGNIEHKPRTPEDFGHTSKPEALAKTFNKKYAGNAWGQISGKGHHSGLVDGASLLAHHVVWMFASGEWPKLDVNHINGKPDDNRISNLRLATKEDISRNLSMNVKNKSGVNGVYFDKSRSKWIAEIKQNNIKIWLGRFDHLIDATDARAAAERELGYHENHGKRLSRAIPI
tara:strand:+ start:225 stop:809 length:585 start_codon:yes stop_codon:yes gene_type:complete